MLGLDAIPSEWQPLASVLSVIAIVLLGAWSRVFGKKEGPAQPRVQEFYAAGQMSDMGPVRELVEQTGLLFQQQVNTNIVLERLAIGIERLATAYEAQLKAEQVEAEIEEEVQRRLDKQLRERRARQRRPRASKQA